MEREGGGSMDPFYLRLLLPSQLGVLHCSSHIHVHVPACVHVLDTLSLGEGGRREGGKGEGGRREEGREGGNKRGREGGKEKRRIRNRKSSSVAQKTCDAHTT